ncbi:MAG: helicase-associated domain-containing protein [Candidatus Nanopelagicaceae bacterium]|nr:helicase-associated domain-containing protein [Candidatus Nanopelagicaceae bacterium]
METRSFTDYLRGLDDAALLTMFALRPDIVSPVPPELSSLAIRANSAPSLSRAVDSLNEWQFQVLEACTALNEPMTEKEILSLTDTSAKFVIPHLIAMGLIYKSHDGIRLPSTLRDVLGNEPAGLGPASMAKLSMKKLDEAPDAAKKVLERLTWGPPRGSVGDIRNPGPGIAWLLKENFLVPLDQRTVVLPRNVALHLRGGKIHKNPAPNPPILTGKKIEQKAVDRAAIANIATLLRWCEEILNFWSEEPPNALRAGGLGVRDLRATAEHLGVDEDCAAFVAELVYLGGLVVIDADDRILPTHAFDLWLTQSPQIRWRNLISLWLLTSRVSGLIGRVESKNIAALGPELDRVNAASARKITLGILKDHPGISPDLDALLTLAKWLAPSRRNSSIQADLVRWTLREAEWLGITGQGVISRYGVRLLEVDSELEIDKDLPKSIDHILIQADNTAIAPGRLEIEIARVLDSVADIESRGGATAYRFSEASIRRGLDHGRTGEEIKDFLRKCSRTPLPQPLDYLITDVAKRHGRLRIGNTNAYLRCEDPTLITQILSDKKLEGLPLRRIAPEVLVCDLEANEIISTLRLAGYLPAAESGSGILLTGQRLNRAKSKPRPPRVMGDIESPTEETLQAALRSLRAGERSSHKQNSLRKIAADALGSLPRTSANETLDLLNTFIKETQTLSIGYADNNGAVTHRIIDPLSINAGSLIARDHGTGEIQTFRIPRITGVAPL